MTPFALDGLCGRLTCQPHPFDPASPPAAAGPDLPSRAARASRGFDFVSSGRERQDEGLPANLNDE